MPILKCTKLEAKTLCTLSFAVKEIKGGTTFSANRKQSLLDGFIQLKIKIKEKLKLKTKLTETKI